MGTPFYACRPGAGTRATRDDHHQDQPRPARHASPPATWLVSLLSGHPSPPFLAWCDGQGGAAAAKRHGPGAGRLAAWPQGPGAHGLPPYYERQADRRRLDTAVHAVHRGLRRRGHRMARTGHRSIETPTMPTHAPATCPPWNSARLMTRPRTRPGAGAACSAGLHSAAGLSAWGIWQVERRTWKLAADRARGAGLIACPHCPARGGDRTRPGGGVTEYLPCRLRAAGSRPTVRHPGHDGAGSSFWS